VHWLFVIARNSSFVFRDRAVDVRQVGRELGVGYVVEGSLRKAGNRVLITAQLIDAATGAHLWAERFEGALDDIFALANKLARIAWAVLAKGRAFELTRTDDAGVARPA
jgi:TolB-like protein